MILNIYIFKKVVWKTFFLDLFMQKRLLLPLPPMNLGTGQHPKVEVSRPDVPGETHFKGSQLQLII